MNKREACELWVNRDMDYIDATMIHDMIEAGIGNFEDITPYEPDDEEDYPPCDWDYGLPMWGTMFSFKDPFDVDWLRDNLDKMKECGFTVFDSDYGYFFGIDGAGYDFYEAHWLPLYDARGLHWHDEKETE